jgi:TonB-dependent receptor-like protein/carboxypeptidase family protein
MIGRTNVLVLTFALAWLYLVGSAAAQIVTGTILGAVTDESKAVLPGVTATITSPVLPGGPQTIATDTKGGYRFPGLAPGTYTLTLTLQGFGTYSEELRVVTGATVERNVALKVGTVSESITVKGESPMVDTRSAAVASTTTREVIENLPIIRTTVTDFVQATPGVSPSSPGAYNEQIQVMGSPSNETTYVHDGVVINHVRTGNTWQGADIDSVEEINTVALGASAEWQSTAGGVVNVVTKSGTNNYEGDFTAYWKPNSLQSQSIKVNCNCPDGQTGFNLGKMRDETAHLGGPIVKDRLWFYTGFQHYAFTYAPPGTYPIEQPTSYWNRLPIKGTWQITDSLKFSSLLHYEWWGGYSTGPTRSVTRQAAQFYDKAHINSYGEEVNKTFGNATILTVRAGGWWEPNQSYTAVTGDLVAPSRTDNFTGLVSQGVPSINRVIMRRDAQSARMERFISGQRAQHSLRFGLQLERAHAVSQTAFPSGVQYYDFNRAPDYALFSDPSVQGAAFNTQGVWAEDQVTVGSRVTFTGGVRWDRMQGTSPDEQAVNNTLGDTGATIAGLGDMFTWHVVSPRAGVNVKLTADGKTVLRATYGRAYRQILLNEIDVVHPGIADLTQRSYSAATGGYTTLVSVTNARSNLKIDPNLSAPKSDTYSVGVDRQLVAQLAVNASYVHKNGSNIIGWRDIGGVYGQGTTTLADGRTLTVYPILNSPSARVFQRTNRADYSDTYDALVASLVKRMSHRWQGQLNLTLGRSEGLRLTGNLGRDPNDVTNATGRLNPTDRPVMFTANAAYEVPRVDVRVSANYQNLSNVPFAPVASVALPQGRRNINIDVPGAFRAERISLLYLRFNKIIHLPAGRKIELIANLVNALQSEAPTGTATSNYITFNYFSPNYGLPTTWVQPRMLYVGTRVNF